VSDSISPIPQRVRLGWVGAALTLLVVGLALHDTLRSPVVRRATIALPYLDPAAGPVRLVFISDLHV
jgi:hypothetical protein